MPRQDGGHRDEEVLGEQLRPADGQKDEAYPKVSEPSTCAVGAGTASAQCSGGHHEGQQAERDVKSAEQAGRGEDGRGPRQATLPVLETVLPDLARLAPDQAPCPTLRIDPPSMK